MISSDFWSVETVSKWGKYDDLRVIYFLLTIFMFLNPPVSLLSALLTPQNTQWTVTIGCRRDMTVQQSYWTSGSASETQTPPPFIDKAGPVHSETDSPPLYYSCRPSWLRVRSDHTCTRDGSFNLPRWKFSFVRVLTSIEMLFWAFLGLRP